MNIKEARKLLGEDFRDVTDAEVLTLITLIEEVVKYLVVMDIEELESSTDTSK